MTRPAPVPLMLIDADAIAGRLDGRWARIEADVWDWQSDVLLAADAGLSVRRIASLSGCSASRVQRIIEAAR